MVPRNLDTPAKLLAFWVEHFESKQGSKTIVGRLFDLKGAVSTMWIMKQTPIGPAFVISIVQYELYKASQICLLCFPFQDSVFQVSEQLLFVAQDLQNLFSKPESRELTAKSRLVEVRKNSEKLFERVYELYKLNERAKGSSISTEKSVHVLRGGLCGQGRNKRH